MSDYVAFIRGRDDAAIAASLFPDAESFWVSHRTWSKVHAGLPSLAKIWIDTSIDGLIDATQLSDDSYIEYIRKFAGHQQIGDPAFQRKPDKKIVQSFVDGVLTAALATVKAAAWLSVPQLPYMEERKRNVLNRNLAEATRRWATAQKFKGRLVLPVILMHQRQIAKKGQRDPYVGLASQCLELSGAESVWVVDADLNDQAGKGNFEHERFPGLIRFHEELNKKMRSGTRSIAGPYWGMNLVLWARQLVHHPAISMGSAHRYYVPGRQLSKGNSRVALPGLRRTALCSPELKRWMEEAAKKIAKDNANLGEFQKLERQLDTLALNDDLARRQVARYYKEWLVKLDATPKDGRGVGLYQDFSSAYVLGKSLPDLLGQEPVRSPSRIAKQFMSNCL
jgi:hypothetical protein